MRLVRLMMAHAATLPTPLKASTASGRRAASREDANLNRLLRAVEAGGHGVDLSKMSDQEILSRLLGR